MTRKGILIRREDWTSKVSPFWWRVLFSSLRPRNIAKLFQSGGTSVRAAMAVPLMLRGRQSGLICLMAASLEKGSDTEISNAKELHKEIQDGGLIHYTSPSPRCAMVASGSVAEPLPCFRTEVIPFSRPHTVLGTFASCLSLLLTWSSNWKIGIQRFSAAFPCLLLANVFIVGLNQLSDVDLDKINKPHLPLPSKRMSFSQGTFVTVACLVASVTCSMLVPTSSRHLCLLVLASCGIGAAYSLPPLRLKRNPWTALACVSVVRGVLVNTLLPLHCCLLEGTHLRLPRCIFTCIFFSAFSVIISSMKDLPDMRGDSSCGVRTFAVTKGRKKVYKDTETSLSVILFLASICISSLAIVNKSLQNALIASALLIFSLTPSLLSRPLFKYPRLSFSSYSTRYMRLWNVFYISYALLPLIR